MAKTTAIKTLDRTACRVLSDAMIAELEALGRKYGVAFRPAGGTMKTATSVDLKINVSVVNPDGSVESAEAADFKKYSDSFGVPASCLNDTFEYRGETFTLIGLYPSRPKFPFVATDESGRRMKFTMDLVVTALKAGGKIGGKPAPAKKAVTKTVAVKKTLKPVAKKTVARKTRTPRYNGVNVNDAF